MEDAKNVYSNSEIKVTYHPGKCIHSGKCYQGLSEVFRSSVIPWVKLDAAESDHIIEQIRKCPSGALQFERLGSLSEVK
ncbi:(4Fe-4S)-binding protein [Aureitalea marina]|uniref:(4Fe-4S)-binding protein n=1 Tax=Aureitalea marina TaxID=930804 RepID=A0A2S7KPH4_9FLAO|nr:(4Fe-4S)-binding protein [Aureitalea marina]PQB04534.1 (4Fe-4S)-binding protein [Aureitalea marina]